MTPQPRQSTCVAIDGRAVLIEGAPGSGKSSLALGLIDRGAMLVGDDSVLLERSGANLLARPHPNTRGLLEVRNLGLVPFPCLDAARVALVIQLTPYAPRYIESIGRIDILGLSIPCLSFETAGPTIALKAELALQRHGLDFIAF